MQVGALQVKFVAQSASAAQVVRQAVLVLSHAYPMQSVTFCCAHCPPVLHVGVVSIDAEQVVGPHGVLAG
jgi:hypothetical protein